MKDLRSLAEYVAAACGIMAFLVSSAMAGGDPIAGKKAFNKCKVLHVIAFLEEPSAAD